MCIVREGIKCGTCSRVLYSGLRDLLEFFVPALFVLGHQVRRLTWDGRVGGSATGLEAKRVLQCCLALQVHITGDWDCRQEYTRTLSVALLNWQPRYSSLPGCCFAEEPCEAMLSRLVGRCRSNWTLHRFTDVLRLWVTLPPPQEQAPATGGGLREALVTLIAQRIRRLLRHAGTMPFAKVSSATTGVWEAQPPPNHSLPSALSLTEANTSHQAVLRGALRTLMTRQRLTPVHHTTAGQVFPGGRSQDETRLAQAALETIVEWDTGRRTTAQQLQRTVERATSSNLSGTSVQDAGPPQQPPLAIATEDVGVQADLARPRSPMASEGAAMYTVSSVEEVLSAGYQSVGDSDDWGSLGDLVTGHEADWDTLEGEDRDALDP